MYDARWRERGWDTFDEIKKFGPIRGEQQQIGSHSYRLRGIGNPNDGNRPRPASKSRAR